MLTFTFLLLMILSSCKIDDVTGLYNAKGGFEWGSSLKINNDSTFVFNWQTGLMSGETKGKWKRKDNILILNSEQQPIKDTLPNFFIKRQYDTNSDSISFKIFWPHLEPLPSTNCSVFAKGQKIIEKTGDNDGNIVLLKVDCDSIKIQFIGLRDIVLKSRFKNNIEIITRDLPETGYEYFTDKTLKIRKDRLIFKTKNIYYIEKTYKMTKK
ncbi:hypothetical protein [uncultured Flavobacterium sp.]|uniref:hypothetical protein n=1 Tax=uncultured Flavobacterium sp. TaxID=165435 RepID=UPI002592511C|nr:hypothetical protein [uncultured Flavobacterium sp.]